MTNIIMVVDDDAALRRTLKDILIDDGRDVISAEDGLQAVKMASEGPIDLILMDIRMPGMNGIEAFLEIKKILPNCTVVFMTGHAEKSQIEGALSEGATHILIKPFKIEQLLEIVDAVMPAEIPS